MEYNHQSLGLHNIMLYRFSGLTVTSLWHR